MQGRDSDDNRIEQLLECLIHVIGRVAIPESRVREIVGSGAKQIGAFNLADGTLSQGDIAKKVKIDTGNLSRTCTRWVEHGVAFWLGDSRDARLVHIYPIPGHGTDKSPAPKRRKRKGRAK